MKSFIFWGIFFLTVLGAGFGIFLTKEDRENLPWDDGFKLNYAKAMVYTIDGDLFVTDNGDRRLSLISIRMEKRFSLNGSSTSPNFYTCNLIGQDGSGGAYFFDQILDEKTSKIGLLLLKQVDSNGQITPLSWSHNVSGDHIPSFAKTFNKKIRYLISNDRGQIEIHEINPENSIDTIIFEINDLNRATLLSVDYDEVGNLLALKTDFTVNRYSARGQELMFSQNFSEGLRLNSPSDLRYIGDSAIVLDDRSKVLSLSLDGSNRITPIYDKADATKLFNAFTNIRGGILGFVDENTSDLYSLDINSREIENRSNQFHNSSMGRVIFAWAVLVYAILGGLILIIRLYIRLLRGKTPLLIKQLSVLIPFIMASVVGISYWIYTDMYDQFYRQVMEKQISWAIVGALSISASDIEKIAQSNLSSGSIESDPSFARLRDQLTKIVGANNGSWNKNIYDYIYFEKNGFWYYFNQFDNIERYSLKPAMQEIIKTKTPLFVEYQDSFSQWLSGFQPIMNNEGKVIALFEITVDAKIFSEVQDSFFIKLAGGVGIAIIVLILTSALMTYILLISISNLKMGAKKLSEGQYDYRVNIRSQDEIADLGNVFNQMSGEIQAYIRRVTSLNEANARFVPTQFLNFLGKESIVDIRLGDQIQREMTVLFSDIRSFTSISEKMTPSENFNFINDYLKSMGPLIRNEGGFIDKYIGDAIMALFPDSPETALKSALAMYENLKLQNKDKPPIEIGVGIHTGSLMLGIVGEEKRFEGTVISDAVNLASRLESLTKYYGADILLSSDFVSKVPNFSSYSYRVVDRVCVKGKEKAIDIYEVFSDREIAHEKEKNKDIFALGLNAWFKGDLKMASEIFEQLSVSCPDDQASSIFVNRIKKLRSKPFPENWTGVTILDIK